MYTPEEKTAMIEDCLENPVLSRAHEWAGSQKADYTSLKVKGRILYDNLRTKHNLDHYEAYDLAKMMYGTKERV